MTNQQAASVKPSLWITRDKLARATTEALSLHLRGHRIYGTKAKHRPSAAVATSASLEEPVFNCAESRWLAPALDEAGLGDVDSELEGTVLITMDKLPPLRTHGQLGSPQREGTAQRPIAPGLSGEVSIELRLQPELECGRCGTHFRATIHYQERLRIIDADAPEQGPRNTRAAQPESDAGSESNPLNIESLDVVELGPKGLALDALLLDALAGALPDLPHCSGCSELITSDH